MMAGLFSQLFMCFVWVAICQNAMINSTNSSTQQSTAGAIDTRTTLSKTITASEDPKTRDYVTTVSHPATDTITATLSHAATDTITTLDYVCTVTSKTLGFLGTRYPVSMCDYSQTWLGQETPANADYLKLDNNQLNDSTLDQWKNSSHLLHFSAKKNKLTALPIIQTAISIDVSFNKIRVLNISTLSKLEHLLYLTLKYNDITYLSASDDNIQILPLKQLNLYKNKLTELNLTDFEIMPHLQDLRVSNNDIQKVIPSVNNFPELERLDLSYNPIEHIDLAIFTLLPKQTVISLINDGIKAVVMSGSPLNEVVSINLDMNDLTSIYLQMFLQTPNLTLFSVRANQIDTIISPSMIVSNMISINLNGNKLQVLNLTDFDLLIGLTALSISENNITSLIPAQDKWQNFQDIDLSKNAISVLNFNWFVNMVVLTQINCSGNNIIAIIQASQELSSLQTVDLSYNRLVHLDFTWFINIPVLALLNTSANNINSLNSAEELNSLKTIDLSNNTLDVLKLIKFDKTPSLTHLFVNDNALSSIEPHTNALKNIEVLQVSGNELTDVTLTWISNLSALSELGLENNRITTIGPAFCEARFDQLQSGFLLALDGNPLNCNESLIWIKECKHSLTIIRRSEPRCAEPSYLLDATFNSLGIPDLMYQETTSYTATTTTEPFTYYTNNNSSETETTSPSLTGCAVTVNTLVFEESLSYRTYMCNYTAQSIGQTPGDIQAMVNYLVLNKNQLTDKSLSVPSIENACHLLHLSAKTNLLTSVPPVYSAISIDLYQNQIVKFNITFLERFSNLTWLYLRENHIAIIPNVTQANFRLRIMGLDLGENLLQSVDLTNFEIMPNLEYLYLDQNNIAVLSPSTHGLSALKKIDMTGNPLKDIDLSLFSSSSLIDLLSLAEVGIEALSINGEPLSSVETLMLSNNKLTSLDLNIVAKTPLLSNLDVTFSKISTVIPADYVLNNTLKISLSHNRISSLNLSLFDNLIGLDILYVSDNSLTTIVPPINTWNRLRFISFSHNSLSRFNVSWFTDMIKVEKIYCENNHIVNFIPSSIPMHKLKRLYLPHNLLETLDYSWFDNMIALEELELQNNRITSFLPSLNQISALQKINLATNQLTMLNLSWFNNSPVISKVTCSNNIIANITPPDNVLTNLKYLYLDSNYLEELNFTWFQNVPNLELLHLQENQISLVIPQVNIMQKLKTLNLSHNNFTDFNTTYFHHMAVLEQINLIANEITTIENPFCQQRFDSISEGFKLYLDQNPLNCTESLLWIKECTYLLDIKYLVEPVCALPQQLAGKEFQSLSVADLGGTHPTSPAPEPFTVVSVQNTSDQTTNTMTTTTSTQTESYPASVQNDLETTDNNPTLNSLTNKYPNKQNDLVTNRTPSTQYMSQMDTTESNGSATSTNDLTTEIKSYFTSIASPDITSVRNQVSSSSNSLLHTNDVVTTSMSSSADSTTVNIIATSPTAAYCNVSPKEGVVVDTLFNITCEGWGHGSLFTYHTMIDGSNSSYMIAKESISKVHFVALPIGKVENNFEANIVITVKTFDDVVTTKLKVAVKPRKLSVEEDLQTMKTILKNISTFTHGNNSYTSLALYNSIESNLNYLEKYQVMDSLLHQLLVKCKVLLLEHLSLITLNFADSITQNNYIIHETLQNSQESFMLEEYNIAAKALENVLHQSVTRNIIPDDNTMHDMTLQLFHLSTISNLTYLWLANLLKTTVVIIEMTTLARTDLVKNSSLTEPDNAMVRKIMEKSKNTINILSTIVLSNLTIGETKTIAVTNLALSVSKAMMSQMNESMVNEYGSLKMTLPEGYTDECASQVAAFSKYDLHVWDLSSGNVSSSTMSLQLNSCNTVSNRSRRQAPTQPGVEAELQSTNQPPLYMVNEDHEGLVKHSMDLSDTQKPVCVNIEPGYNQTLDVYIGFTPDVNTTNYYLQYTLSYFSNSSGTIQYLNDRDFYSYDSNKTLCVSPDTLVKYRVEHIYVALVKQDCLNNIACGNITYSYNILQLNCLLWDSTLLKWTSDNCQVQSGSTPRKVRFKSNLLGSLAAGLFVGPNTINFDTVFDNFGQKLIDNIAVVGTIVTILLMYAALGIICWKADKKDQFKWAVLPLIDNYNEDEYLYEVHVYTGMKTNAGTDANVGVIIAGTNCDSGVRMLNDGQRKNFRSGGVSSFSLATPYYLGDLISVNVWHDNSSTDNTWLLSKIVVVDIYKKQWYMFPSGRWINTDQPECLHVPGADDNVNGSSLFFKNMSNALYSYHIWLTVGYCKVRSSFTRIQRLNCCITVTFLLIVCSAMWYKTDVNAEAAFKLGPLTVTVHQVYTSVMSSAVAIPVMVAIIFLYDRAKNKSAERLTKYMEQPRPMQYNWKSINEKLRFSKLPHWVVYVSHVLVACTIALSAFFTILYAFEWGKEKSEKWLGSLFIGLFETIWCVTPIQIMGIAFLQSFLFRADSGDSEFEGTFGKMQYSAVKPRDNADDTTSVDVQIETKQRLYKQMMQLFSDVFWQIFLLILVLFVVNGNQDPSLYFQNKDLKEVFLKDIEEIHHKVDSWAWIKEVVIPGLYPQNNYNGDSFFEYDKKFITNGYAMKMGPPTLRQIRTYSERCDVDASELHYTLPCLPNEVIGSEITEDFLPRWSPIPLNQSNILQNEHVKLPEAFQYKTQDESGRSAFWGATQRYPGGGYIANLGRSFTEAQHLAEQLESLGWIDHNTRAVLLEFNVWNANTNYANQVIISLEYQRGGGVRTWNNIVSVQLYRYVGTEGLLNLLVELITLLVMLIKLFKLINQVRKKRLKFFMKLSNNVNVLLLAVYFSSVLAYVCRSLVTVETVEYMVNNQDKPVDFQNLTSINTIFLSLLGVTAFILQLQLLNILKNLKSIALLSKVLIKCCKPIAVTSVFLTAMSTAFVFFFTLNYGSQLHEYDSVWSSAKTLILGSLGHFRFNQLAQGSGKFGTLMFLVYAFVDLFIFVNVLTIILMTMLTLMSKMRGDNSNDVMSFTINWLKGVILRTNDDSNVQNKVVNYKRGRKASSVDILNDRMDTLMMITDSFDLHTVSLETVSAEELLPSYLLWKLLKEGDKKEFPNKEFNHDYMELQYEDTQFCDAISKISD